MGTDKNYDRSGVYTIQRTATGDLYVGSSATIKVRWRQHRYRLRKGVHHCTHLQNAWTKYGEDAFEFAILEECEVESLLEREQFHLDYLGPRYNVLRIAGSARGYKHTPEAIERMKGHSVSPETRALLSATAKANGFGTARIGATQSPEARTKMAAAKIGNKHKAGILWSEESKAKSSATQKGRALTPEHREALRLAWVERRKKFGPNGKPLAAA